ncbi:MAG: anaerobic ribonucleoside-triphosphate reductase [Nanoarchaeota archaeon]
MIEMQISGDIYINDCHGIQMPYCFNYSTLDIALEGLKMVHKIKSVPPKYLYSFKSQLEQFTMIASNSTLGATGLADMFIVMGYYVDKIFKEGHDAGFFFDG